MRMHFFVNFIVLLLVLNFGSTSSCRTTQKTIPDIIPPVNKSEDFQTCNNDSFKDNKNIKDICDVTETVEKKLESNNLTLYNILDQINVLEQAVASLPDNLTVVIGNKFLNLQVSNHKKNEMNQKVTFTPQDATVTAEAVFDTSLKQLKFNTFSTVFVLMDEKTILQRFSPVLFFNISTQHNESVSITTDVKVIFKILTRNSNASQTLSTSKEKNKTTCCAPVSSSNDSKATKNCETSVQGDETVCCCKLVNTWPVGFYIFLTTECLPSRVELSIVSTIGCLMSIFGTSATLFVHTFFSELRIRQPTNFLINICICLLLINIVFLSGITKVSDTVTCYMVTALLHYLLLACWFWMSANAYNMYQAFVRVMIPSRTVWRTSAVVAYTLPLLIVTINVSAAVLIDLKNYEGENNFESVYKSSEICWLHKYSLHIGFLFPVALLFIINCFILTAVLQQITCFRKLITTSNQYQSILQGLKISMILITMTGMSWIFGFIMLLSDDSTYKIVTAWIFSILASLQGFFIFVGNCVLHEPTRTLWLDWVRNLCKCKPVSKSRRKTHHYPVKSPIIVRVRRQ